jgi:hypothetical protein
MDTLADIGEATLKLPSKRPPRRRMFRRLNHCAVPGYAPLCVDTNDPETVEVAFKARLMRKIPVANPARLLRFEKFVEAYVEKHIRKTKTLSYSDWRSSTHYDAVRLAQLDAAYESLRGGMPTKRERSSIDAFNKAESYPCIKPGRMINSRIDKAKVWMGPKIKPIEDVTYELPEFVKHIPVVDRPKAVAAFKKTGRKFYQTDYTAYESHFIPPFMRICECKLYKHALPGDPEVDAMCETLMGDNRMHTRTGVKAVVKGRRMSGDMCTSLGNGFTNLMLAKFLAYEKGGEITGFVEGDDGLFASTVELTAEDFESMGFTIKIVEVTDPCTASFCGMVFAESGEIIRDPYRFIENFGWTRSFLGAGDQIMQQLLRAKALSTAYETPQCPIVGAFARHALSVTRGCLPRFVNDGYHDVCPPDEFSVAPFLPSIDTRHLFEVEYGVPVALQIAVEERIAAGDMDGVARLLPAPTELQRYARDYVVVT